MLYRNQGGKCGFIKITKPIQFIKHYLAKDELNNNSSFALKENISGKYIGLSKSNFDVEVSVDALRLLDKLDTFCLFSKEINNFTYLEAIFKRKEKRSVVYPSGKYFHTLKDLADLYINAQIIKGDIAQATRKKPRPLRSAV